MVSDGHVGCVLHIPLPQNPLSAFFDKAETIQSGSSRTFFGANHTCRADGLIGSLDDINLDAGILRQSRGTSAEEGADADVFGEGILRKFFSAAVGSGKFQFDANLHAHLRTRNLGLPFYFRKRAPQSVKINGLLEIAGSAHIFARLLDFSGRFAANDKYWNGLSFVNGPQGAAQSEARMFGHAQVHQDRVGLMLHGQSESLRGIAGVYNLVIVR